MDMQRSDLTDHILADFKWKASSEGLSGNAKACCARSIWGWRWSWSWPTSPGGGCARCRRRVDFTFTYPLRDSSDQVQELPTHAKARNRTAAPAASVASSGSTTDIGIYNESSAAKGGTRVFGEICLVGDLGGGTLDLFISAYGGPGIDFEEVADSAKLGGNELLRRMAEHPDIDSCRPAGPSRD